MWKFIEEYGTDYMVSDTGEVKSLKYNKTRLLKPSKGSGDYFCVILYKNNATTRKSIHRLVANAFIPNIENKRCVNHINGIKTDNTVENLEWCTYSENATHAHKIGLRKGLVGEKHHKSKLSENEVIMIRRLIKEERYTIKYLSKIFGVCGSNINAIKNKKRWKHLKE